MNPDLLIRMLRQVVVGSLGTEHEDLWKPPLRSNLRRAVERAARVGVAAAVKIRAGARGMREPGAYRILPALRSGPRLLCLAALSIAPLSLRRRSHGLASHRGSAPPYYSLVGSDRYRVAPVIDPAGVGTARPTLLLP